MRWLQSRLKFVNLRKMRRSPWFDSARHLGAECVTFIDSYFSYFLQCVPFHLRGSSGKAARGRGGSLQANRHDRRGGMETKGRLKFDWFPTGLKSKTLPNFFLEAIGVSQTSPIWDVSLLLFGAMKPGKLGKFAWISRASSLHKLKKPMAHCSFGLGLECSLSVKAMV